MLPRHPDRLPLAELIAERRKQRDLSLTVTARAMGRAAEEEGSWSLASRQAIHGYEGGRIPNKDSLRWLAHALGLSVDEVLTAAEEQRANRDLIRAANAGSRSRHAGLPPAPQTLPVIEAPDDELEALELAQRIEASDIGSATISGLELSIDNLCRAYTTSLPGELLGPVRKYRRAVGRLLDGRATLRQRRQLETVR